MWEFPNEKKHIGNPAVLRLVETWGLSPESVTALGRRTHIFTHIKWRMTGYLIHCRTTPTPNDTFVWVTPDELANIYALPTAFSKYLPLLRDALD
jgi:A/G-specific adenine glycosylase